MKKGTRWMMMLASVSFLAFVSGCSSDSGETKSVTPVEVSTVDSSQEEDTVDDTESDSAEDTQADSSEAEADSAVTIDEQVLLDQDGIKITAKEYAADSSILGDEIKLLIENNSDKDYTIGCDALIVNDYMVTDLFIAEVAAGKSCNETMDLYSHELEAAGIDSVGKVEIYLSAHDEEYNYLFKNSYSEIQTSAYETMDTTPNDVGMELYNANGIRIVGKTVDEDSFWGTAILLYAENNSGVNVGISVDDMSINGFMMNPLYSTTVYNGKKSIDDITIFSSDLEENGIETIEEVELKFHIYNADTYQTIADSDPITFSAQ